jgi:hypothetical protein
VFYANVYVIIHAEKDLGHSLESVNILLCFVDVEFGFRRNSEDSFCYYCCYVIANVEAVLIFKFKRETEILVDVPRS